MPSGTYTRIKKIKKDHLLICNFCNKEFFHISKNKKYCSLECFKKGNREISIKRFSDPKEREKIRISTKIAMNSPDIKEKVKNGLKKYKQTLKYEENRKKSSERMIGVSPWNKGLTKETDERVKKASEQNSGTNHPFYGKKGKDSPCWKKGRCYNSNGYVMIYCPEHPFKFTDLYVYEHRLVAEKHLGRYLTPEERIHHINDIKDDNRPENLYYFPNQKEHAIFHQHKYQLVSNIFKNNES